VQIGPAHPIEKSITRMPASGRRFTLRGSRTGVRGTRSPLWAQICADVLGIPVHRVEEGEVGAALGAARLGRLAVTGEDPAQVCTRPRRLATFVPRASVVPAYDEAYGRWRNLYPALKERA